jgi:hypothetical protein
MLREVFDAAESRLGRVRDIFLILAICVPGLVIALGSANGVPLERLGGVMAVYWPLILVSAYAAYRDFSQASPWARVRSIVIAAMIVVPVGAKAGTLLLAAPVSIENPVRSEMAHEGAAAAQKTGSGKECKPELLTSESLTVTDSNSDSRGRLAWIFLIGNYYKWDFQLNITGDSNGATGTASAAVETSAWYSVNLHPKTIVATARGNVRCVPSGDKGDKCDCFVNSSADRKTHEDFVVSVDAVGTALTAGADLKISAAADLSGSTALSEISLGKDPLQVKFQNPNTARVGISKAQSYSYRCVAVP